MSVIIAAYNAECFLAETLASALHQSLAEPFEVVVVDDGSSDRTATIAKRFARRDPRVRLIEKENGGSASARNAGARSARGEFLAILDADDRCHPNRLRRLLEAFRKNPDLGLVGSWARLFNASGALGVIRTKVSHHAIVESVLSNAKAGFVLPSIMCRRMLFLDEGGYDERYPTSEDYELISRLVQKTRCANIPEPLYDLRVHALSKTFRMYKQQLYRGMLTRRILELGGIEALDEEQASSLGKKTLDYEDVQRFGIDDALIDAFLWQGYLHRIRQLLLVGDSEHAECFLAEANEYARARKFGLDRVARLGVLQAHAMLLAGAPIRALGCVSHAAASNPKAATSEAALTVKRELLKSYMRYRGTAS